MEKGFKLRIFILIWGLLILSLSGCATAIEGVKRVMGFSTKSVEDNRRTAITKSFNADLNTCFEKTKKILTNMGICIYAQDKRKQMIAVFISEEDTTPVGVFFKAIDANNTQAEVSSPSTYGKESIAARLFPALEKSLKPGAELEETDAKKDKQDK